MKRVTLLATLLAFCVTALAAQATKPTFAGKWTLTDPAAANPMAGLSASLTVAQDDKILKVTAVGGQMGDVSTTYNMDGTEGKSPLDFNGNTIDRATKTKWDGAKLVLTTTVNFNGQTFETVQVWALDATGNLVVESTRPDFQGGGAPVKSTATYKKG
jgi:hypothetical protein